jgi:hypothetical protein
LTDAAVTSVAAYAADSAVTGITAGAAIASEAAVCIDTCVQAQFIASCNSYFAADSAIATKSTDATITACCARARTASAAIARQATIGSARAKEA